MCYKMRPSSFLQALMLSPHNWERCCNYVFIMDIGGPLVIKKDLPRNYFYLLLKYHFITRRWRGILPYNYFCMLFKYHFITRRWSKHGWPSKPLIVSRERGGRRNPENEQSHMRSCSFLVLILNSQHILYFKWFLV